MAPAPAVPLEKSDAISAAANLSSLGDYADMDVPAGYRFIAAGPARVWLERMGNPVDPGLLGVLVPENAKWLVVLEFDERGCVRNLDAQQIDPAAILKAIQDRHQPGSSEDAARIASVKWQTEPKYDAAAHSLEWALRAQTHSAEVLNHTVALLGRRGVLEITAVQPYRSDSNPVPLDELVQRITFKPDQRYDDYRSGDKLATAGFKDLIVGDQPSEDAHQNEIVPAASMPSTKTWIYAGAGGVLVVMVVGIAFFAVKKTNPSKTRPVSVTNGHAVSAFRVVNGNGNGNGNGHGNGKKTYRAVNGNGAGRKKRMFNYSKFYTDMVMGLSGSTYAWVSPGNGQSSRSRSAQPPATPGPVSPASPASPVSPAVDHSSLASANLEIIASQRNLIEEQRNLMREQSRLIEEKARLLKEYNQLVEKWSQDIGNQFSLKLD